MGAFLRRASPGEEGDQRGQQSPPEGREAVEQLHEVGILARVEHMARHDSVQGAQLLLYGHQRIKRLQVVRPRKNIKKREGSIQGFELGSAITCCTGTSGSSASKW